MRFFEFLHALVGELIWNGKEDPTVIPRTKRQSKAPRAKDRLGIEGENLAAARFKKAGWKILERNLALPSCEIDIIARDRNRLVFVEVKTRREEGYTDPYTEVPTQRQNRMKRAKNEYLRWRGLDRETPCRFDIVVIVSAEGKEPLVNHIKDAF
ncbi:MAG: YraN family protein [Thermoguttaceae bacterium]|jgi:putative endonuclease